MALKFSFVPKILFPLTKRQYQLWYRTSLTEDLICILWGLMPDIDCVPIPFDHFVQKSIYVRIDARRTSL